MRPYAFLALIPLLGLSLLTGCGSLLAPQAAPLTYRLAPENSSPLSASKAQTSFPYTLQVAMPRSAAGFETSSIAYRQQPYRLDYYTQSRWVEQPAAMLGERMTQALEQSGVYRVVLAPGAALPSDLRLSSELVALEQVFAEGGDSHVRFVLRMQLIDTHSVKVLATSQLDLTQPSPSADAIGAVTAANQALRDALPKVVQFCIESTPKELGDHR
ncbi:MAG: ABC-type transport auxiliary lipoprotein family protein [Pseudomonadota bacterium]